MLTGATAAVQSTARTATVQLVDLAGSESAKEYLTNMDEDGRMYVARLSFAVPHATLAVLPIIHLCDCVCDFDVDLWL